MNSKENIVQPLTRSEDPIYRALQVSGGRKSSLYNLKKTDRENGFYFLYKGLEVPFSQVTDSNNKTEGIVGIFFGSAKNCPSRDLGLCQLPDTALCYARAGEKRATRKNNEDGSQGMDSYFKGELASYFWDLFARDGDIRRAFMDYLDHYNIKEVRFNLKGDFRHEQDILCIYHLGNMGYRLTGYTARDDLAELCELLGACENIILNGSNRMYTNHFKATSSVEEWLNANYRCLGECAKCRKCYTLRGETITVLIHGKGAETELNNEENRKFIINNVVNRAGGHFFEDKDFKRAKELKTCINKTLEALGIGLSFGSTKEFMEFYFRMGGI